ncbi:MAG: carbohydrate-binding domain-containing protein [Lachnospiraceae bacterium]|nr:carbohydrate-binding domain-containing protein [Lachnospiraceae bacterium]
MSILKRFKNNRIVRNAAMIAASCITALSLSACSLSGGSSVSTLNSKQTDSSAEATVIETVAVTDKAAPSENSSDRVSVTLSDTGSTSSSGSVEIEDGTITITEKGIYEFTGTLSDGQIIVDADDDEVEIILNGVSISNDSSAAIYVKQAETVYITLADGSVNELSTTGEYVAINDNDIDAVIFSKDDLIMSGTGSLTIDNSYGHAVVGKDDLTVLSGTYDITCAEEAFSGNDSLTIENGYFTINSGDDALHSDLDTVINGGTINIESCEEGIEGNTVTINDGEITINAKDDGINAASDEGSSDTYITINGGNILIVASGDGVDANGALYVNGGYTLIYGPTNDGNGSLDYDSTGRITGGTFIAIGSSGMAMNFSEAEQGSILVNLDSSYGEGTTIKLTDPDGNVIIELEGKKTFSSVLISTSDITSGGSYILTVGDTETEIAMDGNIYGSGMPGFGEGFGGPGGQGGFGGPDGNFGGSGENDGERPEMPSGEMPEGFEPPEGFDGQNPPEMPGGQMPGGAPEGKQR